MTWKRRHDVDDGDDDDEDDDLDDDDDDDDDDGDDDERFWSQVSVAWWLRVDQIQLRAWSTKISLHYVKRK